MYTCMYVCMSMDLDCIGKELLKQVCVYVYLYVCMYVYGP